MGDLGQIEIWPLSRLPPRPKCCSASSPRRRVFPSSPSPRKRRAPECRSRAPATGAPKKCCRAIEHATARRQALGGAERAPSRNWLITTKPTGDGLAPGDTADLLDRRFYLRRGVARAHRQRFGERMNPSVLVENGIFVGEIRGARLDELRDQMGLSRQRPFPAAGSPCLSRPRRRHARIVCGGKARPSPYANGYRNCPARHPAGASARRARGRHRRDGSFSQPRRSLGGAWITESMRSTRPHRRDFCAGRQAGTQLFDQAGVVHPDADAHAIAGDSKRVDQWVAGCSRTLDLGDDSRASRARRPSFLRSTPP